jgi:hypothetical protein
VLEQAHRVVDVEVLRQHEDAGARVLGPDALRGDEAFVGVRRRHLDVDHGDVRLRERDAAQQLGRLPGQAGDRHPGALEQAREAVAQKDGIVGDDHLQTCVHAAIIPEKGPAAH